MINTGKDKTLVNISSQDETTHTWQGQQNLMCRFGNKFCSSLSQYLRTLNIPGEADHKLED